MPIELSAVSVSSAASADNAGNPNAPNQVQSAEHCIHVDSLTISEAGTSCSSGGAGILQADSTSNITVNNHADISSTPEQATELLVL